MDVVYNHTFSIDSVFQKTVPYYFYRQEADGSFSDGSACGNDTASERRMYRRYMIDCICYWVKEYHVDTFVMGDDWKGKFDFLKEEGCEVVYLPRTPEISSSQIKEDLHTKENKDAV